MAFLSSRAVRDGYLPGSYVHFIEPSAEPSGFTSYRILIEDLAGAQVAYVDPAAGNDTTGKLFSESNKYATIKAAADSITAEVGYIFIQSGAAVVETANVLDDINPGVKELYIRGAWTSMTLPTTRPFGQVTDKGLEKLEVDCLNGAGAINCTNTGFVVMVEAWSGSVLSELTFNCGDITFDGTLNDAHGVFVGHNTLKCDVKFNTGSITNGNLGNTRHAGTMVFNVFGDVNVGTPSSQFANFFATRDGNNFKYDINVYGDVDISGMADSRSSFYDQLLAVGEETEININVAGQVICGARNFTFGVMKIPTNPPSKFSIKADFVGTGAGVLVSHGAARGTDLKLEGSSTVVGGVLSRVGSSPSSLDIRNFSLLSNGGAAISNTGTSLLTVYADKLYIEGDGRFLFSTNSVDQNRLNFHGGSVIVNDTNASATELFQAASATAIVGSIKCYNIQTNVPVLADAAKFEVIKFTESKVLMGQYAWSDDGAGNYSIDALQAGDDVIALGLVQFQGTGSGFLQRLVSSVKNISVNCWADTDPIIHLSGGPYTFTWQSSVPGSFGEFVITVLME